MTKKKGNVEKKAIETKAKVRRKPTFKQIWFIVFFLATLLYVIINWDKCIDFTKIDGNNVLFGVLIILAFCPIVGKIAISVGDNKIEIAGTKASEEAAAAIIADIMKGEMK